MTSKASKGNRSHKPGRLVIQYLQENERGATAKELLRYLRSNLNYDVSELKSIVESVLQNGTALGFLEREGSHMNWVARETCGRRRRRRRSRRRRRARRCRSCSRRRRKRPRRRKCWLPLPEPQPRQARSKWLPLVVQAKYTGRFCAGT